MSTKTFAMLLIGIIIGSTAGYFGNELITRPIRDDLQIRLYSLEHDFESLEASFNELRSDYDELGVQLET